MKKFKIIHRFPDIREIQDNLNQISNESIEFEVIKDNSEVFYGVDGSTSIDVLIYFEEHWEEMLLYPAVYDILKGSLSQLWLKVYSRFKKAKTLNIDGAHQIEISFKKKKDGEIKCNLKGDLDPDQIEKIMEKLLKMASNDQTSELLSNPEYLEELDEKPRIRLRYNKETDKWEPINYKESRDYWDNWQDLNDL